MPTSFFIHRIRIGAMVTLPYVIESDGGIPSLPWECCCGLGRRSCSML